MGEVEHAASPTERQTRIRRKRDLRFIQNPVTAI
jgi:hypothetical protein